jgi:MFS family permease
METSPENHKIEIDQETLKYLNTTRKWAMFLAIIGFIFLGLIIVIGIIAGTFLSAFSSEKLNSGIRGPLLFILLFLIAVAYFFPGLFLFRFSKHAAHAVQTQSKQELHKAIKNLKSYFVYIGILIIIGLSFYVIALIVAGTSMTFLKGL